MNTWDLLSDEIEPHRPKVLLTEEGIARGIGVNLPAGDLWQEHETHEHVWLTVVHGEWAL